MPTLNPTDLGYLRDQHPDAARVEWYLAVAPYGDACFTARVNDGAIARGAMTIAYDGDVGEANVIAGMTLWVGSSAGTHTVGMIRIRSINTGANTLSVAENDHIEWADDLYLTCPGEAGFREIWGVYQRMTEAGGVVNFYTDYDVVYNDPVDDVLPPKANAGPPVCAWMDAAGNADVSFVGDRSYTTEVGAALSAYSWDFADGAVIAGAANMAGTCAVPNIVRFTAPGFRYVSLTVTDNTAQARTAIVYVPVWVFQEGVQEPYKKVEILSQQGDLSGWRCKLRVFQTDTASEDILYQFPPGALVVLFTKTWYGGTKAGVGGFCHHENIRFTGWLANETLKFDCESGFVEFDAAGNAMRMNSVPGFSFTLEDDATPSDWYEISNLNVDRALHYLLHYHTTVNQVCHVERADEGANRTLKIQIFPDASTYSQAQDHLLKDAQCLLLADRQGVLRATRDPQFMDNADRATVAITCDLVSTDWMNNMDASAPHAPRVGLVRLGGFHYETPLLSQAPGAAPRQQENDLRLDGCILQDQAEANLWSGLALTKANNEFPQVPLTLSGYWPVFDPAFQEYIRLTTTDPLGRNVWVDKRFIVRGVVFRDLSAEGTAMTMLTLEAESVIQTGETVTVPDPPVPDEPPDPPGPPILPPGPPWEGSVKACVGWTYSQLGYAPDLLLHHFASAATAGTGGINLHDAAADFVTLGVAIGDAVEEMGTGPHPNNITTVAAVVSATQLTLTADVGLAPASEYHICGAQWTSIVPAALNGHIIQFLYVRTGANTLGAWLLTNTRVYYTPNILTVSPVWSVKLTIETVRTHIGHPYSDRCYFFGMHGLVSAPGYLIVTYNHRDYNTLFCCVYTSDSGANWSYGVSNVTLRRCPVFGIEIDENTGKIFRMGSSGNPCYIYTSVDGGANSTKGANVVATWTDQGRADLYRPLGSSILYANISTSNTSPGISSDDGDNWSLLTAVGYSDPGGKSGFTGWVYDASDVLTMWEADDDGHFCLLRSSDGGSTWIEIGDANDILGGPIGAFGGTMALISSTWLPDKDVLLWVGLQPISATQSRRICYTHDNGTYWYNKMGNWLTVFGSWGGASGSSGGNGNVGCIPLPRVGANA